ncbi:MAG: hypothetical protein ACPGQS_08525 [Bradymonadia bacterium]
MVVIMFERSLENPANDLQGTMPVGPHFARRILGFSYSDWTQVHGDQMTGSGSTREGSTGETWILGRQVADASITAQRMKLRPCQAEHATPNRMAFMMDSGSPLPIVRKRPDSCGVLRQYQSVNPTNCTRRVRTRGISAGMTLMMQKSPWRAAR